MSPALRLLAACLMLLTTPAAQAEEGLPPARPEAAAMASVTVHLFWSRTCPHCLKARQFLEGLVLREPKLRVQSYVLDGGGGNEAAFVALSRHFGNEPPAVPLIMVGDEAFVGYGEDSGTGREIEARIRACLAVPCADAAAPIIARERAESARDKEAAASGTRPTRPGLPRQIHVPGLGAIDTASLSLPVLTVVLGAVDGFNPCAMWVLVLLIGLLIGTHDPVRMWSYGGAFLLTSGAVYLAFMAAWLNVFLFLGSLPWIRVAIGLIALAAGAYYLGEFVRNPDATCRVTSPGEKQRVMERMRSLVAERSFLVAVAGIVALAVAVNMIELLCSAGIPAVYTQVLAMSGLSTAGYYGYLTLYIAVFMLDDVAIFVAAMLTLQATGMAGTYARWSHLIGGVVLLGVGSLLILKPEWLT